MNRDSSPDAGGRGPMLREPLNRVEPCLEPRRFMRIHRSTLVNVERIRELEVEPLRPDVRA